MTIAEKIDQTLLKSSWIRKMFEEGARLKAKHGTTNVFDFSIGNPNLPPPDSFQKALETVAMEKESWVHGYMANTGFPLCPGVYCKKYCRGTGRRCDRR